MTTSKKDLNLEKLPALSDVLLVEKILQDTNKSIITMTQLEKLLHGKINKNTLSITLDYLEEENRIAVTSRGITWIKSKKKLLELLDKLLEKSELTEKDALRMGREINKNIMRKYYNSFKKDKKNQTLKKYREKSGKRKIPNGIKF